MTRIFTLAAALSAMLLMAACTKSEVQQPAAEPVQTAEDSEQGDPNKMAPAGAVVEDQAMAEPVQQAAPPPAAQ